MVTQEVDLPISPAALLARCADQPYVFALDGASAASWGTGRALLGFRPRATLRIDGVGAARVCGNGAQHWRGDPFELLDRFRAAYAPPGAAAAGFPGGGFVVALNYDLRHWIERAASSREDPGLPILHAAFYDWLLWYSYSERRYRLSSCSLSRDDLRATAAQIRMCAGTPVVVRSVARGSNPVCDWNRDGYFKAVQAILDYIAAGDVYQVNLAQRFTVVDPPAPADLFTLLQQQHPMPYGAYVDGGDFVLVSNSPECFLTLHGATVATYPIKGTRRRGTDAADDEQLARQLQSEPKEQAEHLMIVDLERNDLGKVCRIGSVHVEDFAQLRRFPSLHHVVSKVGGELRPGISLAEILRAIFPGGSITGAPKIRAMQIIDELEPVSRGFYTGAIGFIALDADAVFNLAIRTAIATRGRITYHAGGGIVADSVPEREYAESLLKAQPLFTALNAQPL